jgi:hypothetical protein
MAMDLGAFEVVGEIGRSGRLLRARSPDGGPRAIARFPIAASPEARLERGRRLLLCLDERDGFLPVVDGGVTSEGRWVVASLPAAGSLRERLARGPLEPGEALLVARSVARALERAHRLGIAHGDVGPDTVYLGADGKPLVLGLALAEAATPRSDVSALAATLLEGLGGAPPMALARVLERARSPDGFEDAIALGRALESGTPRRHRGLAMLLLAGALAGLLAALHGQPGATRSVPEPGWVASSSLVSVPREIGRFTLPGDAPPFGIVRITADRGIVVLSGTYGRGQIPSTVVDTTTGAVSTVALAGAIVDPGTHLIVGAARSSEQKDDDDSVPLVVAQRPDGSRVWSRSLGLYGGWFWSDASAGLIYTTQQGGPLDDPLFVLDATDGHLVAGPVATGGVVGTVHVDSTTHRAFVTTDGRTVFVGPPPALAIEREIPDHGVLDCDPVRSRVFVAARVARDAAGDVPRLIVYQGEAARRTSVLVPGSVAFDPVEDRLYVADTAQGALSVIDGESLTPIGRVVVEAAATGTFVSVDATGRRLLVVTNDGERRTLHVLALSN